MRNNCGSNIKKSNLKNDYDTNYHRSSIVQQGIFPIVIQKITTTLYVADFIFTAIPSYLFESLALIRLARIESSFSLILASAPRSTG